MSARKKKSGPSLQVNLSPFALDKLRRIAEQQGVTVTRVVENLLEEDKRRSEPAKTDPFVEELAAVRERQGSDPVELETALLNFVNLGWCELAVPSFFGHRWILVSIDTDLPLERALKRAFGRQVEAFVDGQVPSIPTRPRWRKKDMAAVSPERLGQVIWVWRLLDQALASLAAGTYISHLARCRHCRAIFATDKNKTGRPRHFCTDDHRVSDRDMTAYMRERRAVDKEIDAYRREQQIKAGLRESVTRKPTSKR